MVRISLVSVYGGNETLADGLTTEREFTVALRGYQRDEVDHYVSCLEEQLRALSAEHQAARDEIHELAVELHRVHMRLLEQGRQPLPGEATFSHLGQRAEQLLTLAEEQAHELLTQATTDVDAQHRRARDEVERVLADAGRTASQIRHRAEREAAQLRHEAETEAARITQAAQAHAKQAHAASTPPASKPVRKASGTPRPSGRPA